MARADVKTHTYYDDPKLTKYHDKRLPKPEDIFPVPTPLLNCVIEIAPKIKESGAWWSISGDLSETMQDIHVRPKEIEIVTDSAGLGKISSVLTEYNLTPVSLKEGKLDREAEPDGNKYPVFERFSCTEFTAKAAKVTIQGEYQLKVGEWEWGDVFFFDPAFVNVAGIHVPVMPLGLRSELYVTLGWLDRAKLISEEYSRAHASSRHISSISSDRPG